MLRHMIDGAREGIPLWPLALLRMYAGLALLLATGSPLRGLAVVAGIALLIGFATTAAALVALGVIVSTMLPLHGFSFLASPGPKTVLAVTLVTIAIGRAGRVFGLDSMLTRRHPGNPLW